MTTFSKSKSKSVEDADVKDIAGRLLSMPIISLERIGGGLNSRVYQLVGENASKYFLKYYYRTNEGKRDRLAAEFFSLTILRKNGIRFIPQPIAVDKDEGFVIYEFIEGEKIPPQKITSRDITDAVHFLEELKTLKQEIGILFSASEAFFSIQAVIGSIQTRFDQLKAVQEFGEEYEVFTQYLDHDFIPFLGDLTHWAKNKCSESGISFNGHISEDEKTLSPSDFGFHNALRDKTGQIVFLDFEHFGWDDPAKTISDFLLHPAMALNQDLKQQFTSEIFDVFKERDCLKQRVEILYPFFGLKWCLIFLNEFIPAEFCRRDFARMETRDKQNILREQLFKAQKMLDEVKQMYEKFPFHTSN